MSTGFDMGKEYPWDRFEQIVHESYDVNISDYLSRGWQLFRGKAGEFIGFFVLQTLIIMMAGFIPFAGLLISPPLTAGYFVVAFKLIKGEEAEFGDFFGGFNFFLPLVIAGILTSIFTVIGIVFLIIPGIYLAVGYYFVTQLIVDKNMNFWQAMEVSRRVISRRWFGILGFLIILMLINLLGTLFLLIGLLVTVPWSMCATAVAYEDIFGLELPEQETVASTS